MTAKKSRYSQWVFHNDTSAVLYLPVNQEEISQEDKDILVMVVGTRIFHRTEFQNPL